MLISLAALMTFASLALARPQKGVRILEADSRIIGGQDAVEGQFPSHIAIEYFRELTQSFAYICGGFLFKPRYVVTTAHCVHNYPISDLRTKAGLLRRQDPNPTILPVIGYNQHPEFSLTSGVPNNIAVVHLITPAPIGGNIQLAVLPPNDDNRFVHHECYQTGFGITIEGVPELPEILQWVQMSGLTNEECARQLQGFENAAILESHFCIMSDPPGRGPCNADGGSPVYCRPSPGDTSVQYVAGISSWNPGTGGTCNLQFPSVTTRISAYLQWLENSTPLE